MEHLLSYISGSEFLLGLSGTNSHDTKPWRETEEGIKEFDYDYTYDFSLPF